MPEITPELGSLPNTEVKDIQIRNHMRGLAWLRHFAGTYARPSRFVADACNPQ